MDLTELQAELRLMEQHLAELQKEVEKMKPRSEEESKKNYDAITRLAQLYPLKYESLRSAPEDIKKLFVRGLSFLLQTEEEKQYSRILYLCRLSIGIGLDLSAEEICRIGVGFDMEDMSALCLELADYKYPFLTEAFILSYLSGECSSSFLGLIAEIAEIIKCDREEMRVTAQIAKSVLIGDPDVLGELAAPSRNRWSGKFRDYIPRKWIEDQRKKCAELYIPEDFEKLEASWYNVFTWQFQMTGHCKIIDTLQAGSVVKKGQCICHYKEKAFEKGAYPKTAYKAVIAPCDGIVFFVDEERKSSEQAGEKEKYILIYVVSWFDDYDDFCAWRKENTDKLFEGGTV